LTESEYFAHRRLHESLFSALSVGFFFVLVGVLFVTTSNLFNGIQNFLNDFTVKSLPHNAYIFIPVPSHLAGHTVVYAAAGQFCLFWGIFQIAILTLRVAAGSSLRRKTQTVGSVVVWLGFSYLIYILLTPARLTGANALANWFVFWAGFIIVLGLALIVRAVILATHLWYLTRFSAKTS